MNEMTLSPKAVNMLRVSMAECEKAIGTEYADIYTAKLLGRLETVLELAGDEKQGWTISVPTPYTAVNAVAEPVDLEEDVTDLEAETEPPTTSAPPSSDNLHAEVMRLKQEGKTAKQIAEALNIGVSTVYWHLKFERDMRAK